MLIMKEVDTKFKFGGKGHLELEHITWAPYQCKLIDISLLSIHIRLIDFKVNFPIVQSITRGGQLWKGFVLLLSAHAVREPPSQYKMASRKYKPYGATIGSFTGGTLQEEVISIRCDIGAFLSSIAYRLHADIGFGISSMLVPLYIPDISPTQFENSFLIHVEYFLVAILPLATNPL